MQLQLNPKLSTPDKSTVKKALLLLGAIGCITNPAAVFTGITWVTMSAFGLVAMTPIVILVLYVCLIPAGLVALPIYLICNHLLVIAKGKSIETPKVEIDDTAVMLFKASKQTPVANTDF